MLIIFNVALNQRNACKHLLKQSNIPLKRGVYHLFCFFPYFYFKIFISTDVWIAWINSIGCPSYNKSLVQSSSSCGVWALQHNCYMLSPHSVTWMHNVFSKVFYLHSVLTLLNYINLLFTQFNLLMKRWIDGVLFYFCFISVLFLQ